MSLRIGKVRGIPIRLHFTLLIVIALITWTLASSFMPQFYPDLSASEYWIMGLSGAVLLFGSVLIHELSHSIVAMNYGIPVRRITLFIFGGISEMKEETRNPRKEFNISFAGPAASFALALVFAFFWWLASILGTEGARVIEGVMFYGAIVNVLVGGFNLVPAFPLDGGRILRAVLVKRKRDFHEATNLAVKIGIGISYGFMGLGFLIMLSGNFISGIWLVLIGWFLQTGAQSYKFQHEAMAALGDVTLGDIMRKDFVSIPAGTRLDEARNAYFETYKKSAFPITDNGYLVGMVTLKELNSGRPDHATVEQVMLPLDQLAITGPEKKADEAFMRMARTGTGRVFVLYGDGKLAGLVSKTDLLDLVKERQEYSKNVFASKR
jgi:Zn-dependent protease/predicted transcriptional regulator